MPNWVYSSIEILDKDLSDDQLKVLKSIKSIGLCEHYIPIPREYKDLNKVTSNLKIIAKKDCRNLDRIVYLSLIGVCGKKYGYKHSYEWKCNRWGSTVISDLYVSKNIISYNTSWSALSSGILNMIVDDFPNINYEWEEEQGYGARFEIREGILKDQEIWDIPDVREIEILLPDGSYEDFIELLKPHRDKTVGIYNSYSLEDKIADTKYELEEFIKKYYH